MSECNYEHLSRNGCNHENILQDDREGSIICTDCALVLEDKLYFYPYANSSSFSDTSFKSVRKTLDYNKHVEENRLRHLTVGHSLSSQIDLNEIVQKLNLSDSYLQEALDMYNKLELSRRRFKVKEAVGFCLYHTLIKHNCARSPEEIAYLFELDSPSIFIKIEKECQNCFSSSLVNVNDFVERFCKFQNISYKHSKIIESICLQLIDKYNFNPKTLSVLVISCFIQLLQNDTKLSTIKLLCRDCNISYANLYRIFKKFPNLRHQINNLISKEVSECQKKAP